jgi:glucose dehydrogenase
MFDENGIFCIQSGREERWPPKFVRHGRVHLAMFSQNVCITAFSHFKNKGNFQPPSVRPIPASMFIIKPAFHFYTVYRVNKNGH